MEVNPYILVALCAMAASIGLLLGLVIAGLQLGSKSRLPQKQTSVLEVTRARDERSAMLALSEHADGDLLFKGFVSSTGKLHKTSSCAGNFF